MHTVYFGLGTNLGRKEENIHHALKLIAERIGQVVACSAFCVTAPVGFESDNQFLNAACKVETSLSPLEILHSTQKIEMEMGRKSKSINGQHQDRIIDIDILLYDAVLLDLPELKLPHPHLHEREFVIVPLVEIASEVVHPVLGKTMVEFKNDLFHSSDLIKCK